MLGSILAVIIGYIFGWLGGYVRQRAHDVVTSNAVTLVIPFGAYLAAESVHALRRYCPWSSALSSSPAPNTWRHSEAEERLSSTSFWQIIELLMTGVAFGLIGLQASSIIATADPSRTAGLFVDGALVALVAILVRLIWFTIVWLAGRRTPSTRCPESFAEVIIMTWSGMRGLVTLILALSIPVVNGTEQVRQDAIVMMLSVLFFTLVLPGLTRPCS